VANFSFKDDFSQRCFTVINKVGKALIFIAAIVLGAVSLNAPADVEGSELRFQPSILLSEEYNDNVLLTTESKYDDYITRTAPSFSAVYRAHNWEWNVDYNYNYLYYAKKTTRDDSSFDLNLVNKNMIIEDVLFLNVRDQYSRVSLDVTRDYTKESNFVNQTDRNLLTINPYFVLKPLSQMSITTGYIYMDTWYKDPLAIDRTDHIGYADVRQDFSPRSAMIAGVSHTLDINTVEGYTQDDLYLGQYYEYAENSAVTFKVGNTWFDFENKGRVSQMFWEATIIQRYPTVTVTYETGLRFIPDPLQNLRREDRYLATIRKDVERTSLVVSGGLIEYREAEHNHLENTSYQLTGTISHSITTNSKLTLNLAAERLDDNQAGTYLETYRTGVRLEYFPREKLTLALDYRYTNVYSPYISSGTYDNNRFTVELRKIF
jgi:hypothetical protein